MTPLAARSELAKALTTESKGAFLIYGPTLIGKTWLIEELRKNFIKSNKRDAYIHHFICSSSHTGYEPVLDAIDFLAKRENWSLKKQAKFLGIKYSGKIVGAAGWVARAFFPDAIPKEILGALKESLENFAKQQPDKIATLEFPRADSSKISKFIDTVVEKSGRPLVMIIDRLEELPTPGIKLLQMLVDTKPNDVLIVVSISSESSAFFARPDIRELVNSFKRIGRHVYQLVGYSANELRSMRELAGFRTSPQAAENAFEYSLEGRIGLVRDWLDSADLDNQILKPAADQLVAHYAIQYGRLSDPEKNFVKFLGAVYPNGVGTHAAAASLVCSLAELESKIQGVFGMFAALSKYDIVLSNAHVLHFLKKEVGSLLVQAAYTDVSTRLVQRSLLPATVPAEAEVNTSFIPLSVQAMNAQSLVHEVRDDLLRGAHQRALSRLNAWRGWMQNTASVDEEVDLLLLEADALGQLGSYRLAIDVLDRVPAGSSREVDVAVSMGEKYWRAGEHSIALRRFATARKSAEVAQRHDAWLKAATRTVAVKNESREGIPSVRLATTLVKYCDSQQTGISDRDRCLVYRTVARTLVLVPAQRAHAEKYARAALDIALKQTKSMRDEGNCRYALGDVFRHMGQYENANTEFDVAKKVAEETGNYDLKLYCLLAITACALGSGNTRALGERIRELNVACNDTESPEYKIIKLFMIASNALKGDYASFIDPTLSVHGRPWTSQLLKTLSTTKSTPQAIQRVAIIL